MTTARRITLQSLKALLLAALTAATLGCASAQLSRAIPDLPARGTAVRAAGLFPPAITVSEYRVRETIRRDDWSSAATDALRQAFIDEMAADHWPLVILDANDPELNDIADLYGAVGVTIAQNANPDTRRGWMPPRETFPEKVRCFDYSLGPAYETMERHQVDAVWFVTGHNLLRTSGRRFVDGLNTFFGVLGSMGGAGPTHTIRLQVEAALVDKSGAVLFYCALNELNVPDAVPIPGPAYIPNGERAPTQAAGEDYAEDDLRDPRTARVYVRALLTEYHRAVNP